MGQGQLVEQLGIWVNEIDGYGASGFITDNATFQCAGLGIFQAFVSTDDHRIEATSCGARNFEDALQRGHNVFHAKFSAIRKLDPFADLENIGLAVIGGLGEFLGNVGNLHEAISTSGLLESNQTVIG